MTSFTAFFGCLLSQKSKNAWPKNIKEVMTAETMNNDKNKAGPRMLGEDPNQWLPFSMIDPIKRQ